MKLIRFFLFDSPPFLAGRRLLAIGMCEDYRGNVVFVRRMKDAQAVFPRARCSREASGSVTTAPNYSRMPNETSDVGNAFAPDVTATSLLHPDAPSLERPRID